LLASGQNIPRVIRKEMQHMTEIVNGYKRLEEYRTDRNATTKTNTIATPAPKTFPDPNEPANTRQVRGTINLNSATIYALREKIVTAEDASVWSKIVASAEVLSVDPNALGEEWSFVVSNAAPASLWFVVTDHNKNLYITQTAISTSTVVVLDIARMTKLN